MHSNRQTRIHYDKKKPKRTDGNLQINQLVKIRQPAGNKIPFFPARATGKLFAKKRARKKLRGRTRFSKRTRRHRGTTSTREAREKIGGLAVQSEETGTTSLRRGWVQSHVLAAQKSLGTSNTLIRCTRVMGVMTNSMIRQCLCQMLVKFVWAFCMGFSNGL